MKSGGNSSCCPSTLLLQVSDEFLLFCFLDAHLSASVSETFMFLSGGLSSIPVWMEGIGRKKKNMYVYIYLKMDCQCLNHMIGKERRDGRERQKEKVILLVVTRGDISCREIAVYCFCGRGNVNWLCGCATSHGGRRRTKWTQNTPWEGSQFL